LVELGIGRGRRERRLKKISPFPLPGPHSALNKFPLLPSSGRGKVVLYLKKLSLRSERRGARDLTFPNFKNSRIPTFFSP
jgi:hypothetical protein